MFASQRAYALINAAKSNQLEAVEKLLIAHESEGIDPNYQSDAAQKLLNANTYLNFRDKEGSTALFRAVSHNNALMIKRLLKAGADPAVRYMWNGESPVFWASRLAKDQPRWWASVNAFSEAMIERKLLQEKNLLDVVRQVKKGPINRNLLQLFNKTLAEDKDELLVCIMNIKDPKSKQKALWQALSPETYLGQWFHLQRGNYKPSIYAGRLREIVKALDVILITEPLCIDPELRRLLKRNSAVRQWFPILKEKAAKQVSASAPPPYTASSSTGKVLRNLNIREQPDYENPQPAPSAPPSKPRLVVDKRNIRIEVGNQPEVSYPRQTLG